MKYRHSKSDLSDIQRHARNKNLVVLQTSPGIYGKIIRHLSSRIGELQIKSIIQNRNKAQVIISEQIVENPLILRNLRDEDKTILDFGGFESLLPLQLSSIGYQVTVLDQREYPFQHPNLKVACLDLFHDNLSTQEQYDVVISISTIEHLGLNAYGDSVQKEAGKQGVAILWSLVKQGGRLMASLPAGKPAIQRGYQVYNEAMVQDVFPNATSIRWFMKEGREGVWGEVESKVVENLVYSEPYGQMPVEAVVFVICDKK